MLMQTRSLFGPESGLRYNGFVIKLKMPDMTMNDGTNILMYLKTAVGPHNLSFNKNVKNKC